MKTEVTQTLFNNFSDIPVYASIICFALAVSIFLFLILHQQVLNIYKVFDARFAAGDEQIIMEIVTSGNNSLLSGLHRTHSTRDMIIRIASKLQGESVTQLVGIYSYLGFAVDDFKRLATGSLVERMRALQRCRTMRLTLPEEAWATLLRHPDQTFRWASMEYLILLKTKDSLLWLLWFLKIPQNQQTGMALHLCCCFAKNSPMAFPFLLDHSDDPFLKKIWLQTLALYPVPGSEDVVMSKLGQKPSVDLLCMAMKALGASSSNQTKGFLLNLAMHKDWNVRKLLAEVLQNFSDGDVIDCLGYLAEDVSFPVRMSALETLSLLGEPGHIELERIADAPGHPSNLLVHKIIGLTAPDKRTA
jgi:hypothetical protein